MNHSPARKAGKSHLGKGKVVQDFVVARVRGGEKEDCNPTDRLISLPGEEERISSRSCVGKKRGVRMAPR